jgi:hypothetical protein
MEAHMYEEGILQATSDRQASQPMDEGSLNPDDVSDPDDFWNLPPFDKIPDW